MRFAMRKLQEFVEETEFMEKLERRRMDRVAAKIAKEIRVLLQHDDIDSGAGQEKRRHHAGGPAADDAAAGGESLGRGRVAACH